jgi:uncharacterized membrane protein YidH (DUF202 family)
MVKSSPKILAISARSLQKLPSDDSSSLQNSPAERSVRTEQPDSVDSHSSNKEASRWTRLFALSLQNTGSVARDHLSSERTWLAYVRTSLSIASAGVGGFDFFFLLWISIIQIALVQLFAIGNPTGQTVHEFARPLGLACVCIAFMVLSIGDSRKHSFHR